MSNQEEKEFSLDFETVCEYVFERLTERGYVPESDELLDVADIVMDFTLSLHIAMGGEIITVIEDLDDKEEE
jgi:hypothetical protein